MRVILILIALLFANPAQATCRLALLFGMDISSSVNSHEYRLQMDGLAAALEVPEVMEAILTPEGTGIAVAAYEWSGWPQQDLIAGWTMLKSRADIHAFANRLRNHKRAYADYPTAIGKALEYGAALMRQAPLCQRRVIDLSGDGANNNGPEPEEIRARGDLAGLTINGLVILGAYPHPGIYYREHVMQGPNAFVAIARTFEDYRPVMVGKLLREINAEMILGDRR